jgi:hypothetical protein
VHTDTVLTFRAGRLAIAGWPPGIRMPHAMQRRSNGHCEGPARLRAAVRRTLAAAGAPVRDAAAPASVRLPAAPAPGPEVAAIFATWLATGEGIAIGLPLPQRAHLVHLAAATLSVPALVVVRDTGAVAAWGRALAPDLQAAVGEHRRGCSAPVTIATAAAAAWDMGWLGGRHELLAVDAIDLVPLSQLAACVDGSVALLRLGFAAAVPGPDWLARGAGIGPILGAVEVTAAPRTVELCVPLAAAERRDYEAAWHDFFAAFDRFATLRPAPGFADFVHWARGDPAGRPGLLAWHRALGIAGWTAAKAATVAALLLRHRGQRILLFTPDCETAYALARDHLIAAVTAELPRREREALLAGFTTATPHALVGPRLLETGIAERSADVGILIGASVGRAQRRARIDRVAAAGIVYELLSQDTMEVGRARRLRGHTAGGTTAATLAAVDPR